MNSVIASAVRRRRVWILVGGLGEGGDLIMGLGFGVEVVIMGDDDDDNDKEDV